MRVGWTGREWELVPQRIDLIDDPWEYDLGQPYSYDANELPVSDNTLCQHSAYDAGSSEVFGCGLEGRGIE